METKPTESKLVVVSYCRNCFKNLPPDAAFCESCGAKIIKNRITTKNLLEDFNDRFLSIDGALPKTFIALFTKPEDVIGGYINGVRKRYISAFGYFALSLTIAGIYVFVIKEYFLDTLFDQLALSSGSDQAQVDLTKKITIGMNEYQGLLSIISIPLLALISRIVFWNYKQFNYLEHVVIYLYAFSHINIIFYALIMLSIWSAPLYSFFSLVGMFGYIIYTGYVLKRLYNLNAASLILKTSLFLLIGSVLLLTLGIVIGIVMVKLGMIDEMLENIQNAQSAKI
ncbi:MAG: DUF3667 domain-containing protein [Bacteroidota bacterium]|nr:DUF3667 domain-containing protein [Bacteroidota bacterium]MEE3245407.1 DUF3667 domain-containing protein [Bacteroidota bacterium]